MAARAAEYPEAYSMLDQISDEVGKKIDRIINGYTAREVETEVRDVLLYPVSKQEVFNAKKTIEEWRR